MLHCRALNIFCTYVRRIKRRQSTSMFKGTNIILMCNNTNFTDEFELSIFVSYCPL